MPIEGVFVYHCVVHMCSSSKFPDLGCRISQVTATPSTSQHTKPSNYYPTLLILRHHGSREVHACKALSDFCGEMEESCLFLCHSIYLRRGHLYMYTRPTLLPEAALPPEAASPPGTCPAEPFSYLCMAEPLRTGE